ncbi:MAG: sulfatase [Rhodothermaceae bacterium]|nr:sulfatase [Rhodothermaceae bacterium]
MNLHAPAIWIIIASCVAGCASPEQPPEQPNIVWLIAEDISPALGSYGDPLAITPNLDALAEKSIVYDRAYATAPICAPARSALVSGLYATSMGTMHLRSETPFSENLKTLPEYLADAGYYTSNQNKTDYNFDPTGRWNERSGSITPWRNKEENQPFYSVFNFGTSHESRANREQRYQEAVAHLPEDQFHSPDDMVLPPYYPDTPLSREVWARYYDTITVMDHNVGTVLDSLEADGLMDDTIIFFFGDHGHGLPRYKRWLYHTGLHVPFFVYIPEKYEHLTDKDLNERVQDLVSFVDFPATTLNLAGVEIPSTMEGLPFLGPDPAEPRSVIFGARDRADDMFEMSRAVVNERYIYVRHYMPHLPYIQSGVINSNNKLAYRALREAHENGDTDTEQTKLWNTKPVEELYDLVADPMELNNLADNPEVDEIKAGLRAQLHAWVVETRDLGLLPEAEYMIRSEGTSPYDYARHHPDFDAATLLNAAELVGTASQPEIIDALDHADSGVRYWASIAMQQEDELSEEGSSALENILDDPSPSTAIAAAEALAYHQSNNQAIETLEHYIQDDRPWVALQAARSVQMVGEAARPIIPTMYEVLEKNQSDDPNAPFGYKDFNYAAFTSWALEWAMVELGEDVELGF